MSPVAFIAYSKLFLYNVYFKPVCLNLIAFIKHCKTLQPPSSHRGYATELDMGTART
jgi:hypothetical protein